MGSWLFHSQNWAYSLLAHLVPYRQGPSVKDVIARACGEASDAPAAAKPSKRCGYRSTLWLFNIAMDNGPFIADFPIKTPIYSGFSMAMLNNQMVDGKTC